MEALMGSDPPLHWDVRRRIKGWYRVAFNCALPPAQVTLDRITAKWVELYSYVPPLGANILISAETFPLDNSVPTEDKIEWAVKLLRNPCSGGPPGMRAEHLKRWMALAA